MTHSPKQCRFCGCWFRPDPRVGNKQIACFRRECQQERHRQSDARWRANNPDHFQGRLHYLNHKNWLAKPGNAEYLKNYRETHPAYVAADNRRRVERRRLQKARERTLGVSDMKDAIHRREATRAWGVFMSDMKDAMRLRLDGMFEHMSMCPYPPLSDMKDSMVFTAGAR
jgi:hypothetical protein